MAHRKALAETWNTMSPYPNKDDLPKRGILATKSAEPQQESASIDTLLI